MKPFTNFNDDSSNPPRLQIGHTLWGMQGLPMNDPVEWTLDEKFARIKDAGFEHVECTLRSDEQAVEVSEALRKADLKLSVNHRPLSVEDTRIVIERAKKSGALWVVCQPASAYHSLAEVIEIVRNGAKIAADQGLPYFVETHRNNFTETIRQTLELIDAVPEIKLTADFSHFVLGGEFYGWEGEGALERMQPIIEKVANVHGRISSGEQIQVDVGDGQSDPSARFFVRIWTEIFKAWRKTAQSGDILPFSSELGPPRYSITTPDGKEISDRWEQSLVMRNLAVEAWGLSG